MELVQCPGDSGHPPLLGVTPVNKYCLAFHLSVVNLLGGIVIIRLFNQSLLLRQVEYKMISSNRVA